MRRLPDLVRQTGLTLNVEADNRPVDLSSRDVDCAIRYALQPSPEGHWLPLFEDRVVPLCAPELVQEQLPQDDFDILRLPLIEYRWALGKIPLRVGGIGRKSLDCKQTLYPLHSSIPRKLMLSTQHWQGRGLFWHPVS